MAVTGGPPWVSRPSVGGARPNASVRRVAANYHGIHLAMGAARYGVRSAVTSRASLIAVFLPAARRQEASKFGQAFCEQLGPTVLMSSRSALARACGTLASTCGANPGRTVSAAAIQAAMAIAERALIMTVPCMGLCGPSFRWLIDYSVPVSGSLCQRGEWFRSTGVLFRRRCGMKHIRLGWKPRRP